MRYPRMERRGTTAEMIVLEMLAREAIARGDAREMGTIAYAWCLLGWNPDAILDIASGLSREMLRAMVDAGQARRETKLLRAEARGIILAMELLSRTALRESWVTQLSHDYLHADQDRLRLLTSRYLTNVGWAYQDVDDRSWWEPVKP